MNICIISQSYPPSLWNSIGRTTYSIAQGLTRRGHKVTVLTYSRKEYDQLLVDKGVRIQSFSTDGQGTLAIPCISQWQEKVTRFINSFGNRVDLFICIDSYGYKAISDSRYSTKKVIGICNFTYNVVGWLKAVGKHHEDAMLAEELEFFRSATTLLANNDFVERKIQNLVGRVPHRYTVGIAEITGYNRNDVKKGQVLYVGKLNQERGLERVIRAMVAAQWMTLVICDQNTNLAYRDNLCKLSKQLGIAQNRIHYTGFLQTQQVWKLYAESEMCVVPHIAEPFGYAAIYPMMLGCPTIVSTAHCLPEIIGTEDAGAVFKNIDELDFYLNELHHMPMLQRLYGENGRKRVLEHYSLTKMIDSISRHF